MLLKWSNETTSANFTSKTEDNIEKKTVSP